MANAVHVVLVLRQNYERTNGYLEELPVGDELRVVRRQVALQVVDLGAPLFGDAVRARLALLGERREFRDAPLGGATVGVVAPLQLQLLVGETRVLRQQAWRERSWVSVVGWGVGGGRLT